MNTKPITDNSKRSRAKKKKEAIDVLLTGLSSVQVDDRQLSGDELADYADALAGAKIAQQDLNAAIQESEKFLKSAMLRQYCDHYVATGRPPDLRRSIGRSGSFSVVQQRSVKISAERAKRLASFGIDISPYETKTYNISLGKADEQAAATAVAALKSSLGDEYHKVVSEEIGLGDRFFGDLLNIVRSSLTCGERLDEKMIEVLRILNPTIQFKEFNTDLSSPEGFDLAYEFSKISGRKDKAIERSRTAKCK